VTSPDDHAPDAQPRPNEPRPVLVLVGEDGNAFAILGRARRALQAAGRGDEWAAFVAEATSGDYNHLLATAMRWFDVE